MQGKAGNFWTIFLIIGGYKGYGLGFMVELFCGILSGSAFGPHVRRWDVCSVEANLVSLHVCLLFLLNSRGCGTLKTSQQMRRYPTTGVVCSSYCLEISERSRRKVEASDELLDFLVVFLCLDYDLIHESYQFINLLKSFLVVYVLS